MGAFTGALYVLIAFASIFSFHSLCTSIGVKQEAKDIVHDEERELLYESYGKSWLSKMSTMPFLSWLIQRPRVLHVCQEGG